MNHVDLSSIMPQATRDARALWHRSRVIVWLISVAGAITMACAGNDSAPETESASMLTAPQGAIRVQVSLREYGIIPGDHHGAVCVVRPGR